MTTVYISFFLDHVRSMKVHKILNVKEGE